MAPRAQVFMNMHRSFGQVMDKVQEMLSNVDVAPGSSDQMVIDTFLIDKEFHPRDDLEQLVGLLERLQVPTSQVEIIASEFKDLMRKCDVAMEGCPFLEPVLTHDGISGHGDNNEEISITFEDDDILISIDPPHYEDEDEDSFLYEEKQIRDAVEQWLLDE